MQLTNVLTIPTFPLDRLSHRPCPWGRRECNNSILSLRGGRRREAPTFKISDTACKKINYYIIKSLIFKIILVQVNSQKCHHIASLLAGEKDKGVRGLTNPPHPEYCNDKRTYAL